MNAPLTAVALSSTLKPSPGESSSDLLASQILTALAGHGVTGEVVRVVDHVISPGVEKDMGGDDEWPSVRRRTLDADILVLVTPTWMGQHSSVAQRVLERLDAELSETDARGRLTLLDKVAIAGIGEAMHTTDYKDLDETPEKVAAATATAARNAAHLARVLREREYPNS